MHIHYFTLPVTTSIALSQLADELQTVRGFQILQRVAKTNSNEDWAYEATFRQLPSSTDLTVVNALVNAHVPDGSYAYRQNPQANYEHANTDGATIGAAWHR